MFELFPFAFGPENPLSREVLTKDENGFTARINFAVDEAPECAAIATIFDRVPKRIEFSVERTQGDIKYLTIELKGREKIKYCEIPMDMDTGKKDFKVELRPDTTEIVFCFWRNANSKTSGEFKVTRN